MIKIISGCLKGLGITSPKGEATRPTTSRVREAVLNSLAAHIDGATFLDFFAGSGAMGLEALSWGAKQIVFLDYGESCIKLLHHNLSLASQKMLRDGLDAPEMRVISHRICTREIYPRSLQGKKADILWFDPPYTQVCGLVMSSAFWCQVDHVLAPEGFVILECKRSDAASIVGYIRDSQDCQFLSLVKHKNYSDTSVLWARRK
ncbi:MAG: RsmD family RNA methyltransferase [Zetaproteobacteria bacterium]|nr:RsmD family RNA methyltransferase [Zetaproteobacteria bacterium]